MTIKHSNYYIGGTAMKKQFKTPFESNKNVVVKTTVFDIVNIHGKKIFVLQRRCLIPIAQLGNIPHFIMLRLFKDRVLCEASMVFTEESLNKLKEILKEF